MTEQLPRWDGPLSHPFYSKVVKRALDFVMALILLIPCSFLMIPIAIAVKLDSPGTVFYRAPRGGYHNKTFYILKFRPGWAVSCAKPSWMKSPSF